MSRNVVSAIQTIRRVPSRLALAVAALALLLLGALLLVRTGEGAGSYNLNGRLAKIRVDYSEPCNPGQLVAPATISNSQGISPGNPLHITTSGDVGGCLAVDAPPLVTPSGAARILIADSPTPELFFYTTVTAKTTLPLDSSSTGVVQIAAFPTGQNPVDWPSQFPTSGQAYIGVELVNYTGRTDTTITITARNVNGLASAHLSGSLVRLQGHLKLVARNQRVYVGYIGTPVEPTSGQYSHSASAVVRSPKIQLSCRSRLEQPAQTGNDNVLSRSKCYAVVEPGPAWNDNNFPNALQTPAPAPFPDMAIQALLPGFYHELSSGLIDDASKAATQNFTLTTGYLGISCFPYIEGSLWSKITSTIGLSTNFAFKTARTGQFRIGIYNDSACTTPAPIVSPIGQNDSLPAEDGQAATGAGTNLRITWLNPDAQLGKDTDGDGCGDYRELGGIVSLGGLRDPFNRWDYMNPLSNDVNRVPDISAVVAKFGIDFPNPAYHVKYDRGGTIGGILWSNRPPNGTIRAADITAAVQAFGHDCPVVTPTPNPTPTP